MSTTYYGPAYDYDCQTWVHGAAAVKIHLRAIREQLACLTSPRGTEYARFIGIADVAAAVAELETQEAKLEATRPEDTDTAANRGPGCEALDLQRAENRRHERSAA